MADALSGLLLGLYYTVLGLLAAYGVHRLVLVGLYLRHRRDPPASPTADTAPDEGLDTAPPAALDALPWITVQLPIYNELFVATRLLDAVARLEYPADRLEIQVLDDSTDETSDRLAAAVALWRARGLDVAHLRRDHREGFKAGALAAGLAVSRGELVAIFDADFVPPANFLHLLLPSFADPRVGMVQACWEHLDRDASLLSRVQAVLLDGHFRVEHTARHRAGCFFNFNGTAGIWRRQAIEEAGGWQGDTLTEDLDLSYRAQLAGWRFVYRPEVTVAAELPGDVNAWKSQQHRWALGSIQTARKLLPALLRAPLPLRVKAEATIHLTNNVCYLLMVLLSLLVFPAMLLRRGLPAVVLLALDLPLLVAASGSVLLFYAVSQLAPPPGGSRTRGRLRDLLPLLGLGLGLAVSNSRAVLRGLTGRSAPFARTPKSGRGEDGTAGDRRYRLRPDPTLLAELTLAALFLAASAYAVMVGMWASLPFLYLFLQGYTSMAALGLASLRGSRGPALAAVAPAGHERVA